MAYSKHTPPMRVAQLVITDVLVFGVALLTYAYFHHVRPKAGGEGTAISTEAVSSEAGRVDVPEDATYVWSMDVTVGSTVRLGFSEENKVVSVSPEDDLLKGLSVEDAVCELIDRARSVNRLAEGSTLTLSVAETAEDVSLADVAGKLTDAKTAMEALLVSDNGITVEASLPALGLGAKFYDKFNLNGTVTSTDTSYVSDKVAVFLTETEYAGAVCHVADIYLCDVHDYRTVLAKDTYGKNYSESVESMSSPSDKYPERETALLAVNGDYYGAHASSFIVRNGVLYSDSAADDDICVLYADGTMESYYEDSFDGDKAVENGAWQAWSFGPKLLEDGETLSSFNATVTPRNPRTALGYYEPGHYCIVTVDGRIETSRGLSLTQLSAFFGEELGCTDAYNLDGGNTTVMFFNGEQVNTRSGDGRRPCSDAVIITDIRKDEE